MRSYLRASSDAMARLFSSRANYWAEFFLDGALTVLLVYAGCRLVESPWIIPLALVLGLLLFSFVEYFFHRWMFHTRIPLFERGHRMHHENPKGYDSLPFFLPAVVAIGLAALGVLVMPAGFVFLMIGAATFGYILYGLSHFTIHHVRFRQPLLMRWAALHHIHHHHPKTNFGVTSPLWDILLGTRYVRRNSAKT
ncbi:MAG: sterol desaturase family protein [Gammaproteobacteria bacterium]|nr:sterol desaturase family protein [Gammaproteobacteria bacterium]